MSFSDLLVIKSHQDRREEALQRIPSEVKDNTNGNFLLVKKELHNHFQKTGKKKILKLIFFSLIKARRKCQMSMEMVLN